MPFSHSQTMRMIAYTFAVVLTGFGINAMSNPVSALSFFELEYPSLASERKVVDVLLLVYGARDIFMGFMLFVTAFFGSPKATGWTFIGCWSHGSCGRRGLQVCGRSG
ncbi:uncharacterized protein MYCGRDRAFT_90143 [Zymoseptoria tritici IPO323]|uniref:Uncharacterized protein n=1 Tax=Zymoseptoria tritici (strain CBS 115943 / IPO323) TaxID=336722 RepID=F9X0P5_ZYMTI|nr:uncharacterized protein MYCGRDRAFT_90143 [Zymoseptoria tritici IPO323]EGP91714.1 hypothetical protein MYCGRDRAFT_90143 [Zymoseptoria tritici IPO323]